MASTNLPVAAAGAIGEEKKTQVNNTPSFRFRSTSSKGKRGGIKSRRLEFYLDIPTAACEFVGVDFAVMMDKGSLEDKSASNTVGLPDDSKPGVQSRLIVMHFVDTCDMVTAAIEGIQTTGTKKKQRIWGLAFGRSFWIVPSAGVVVAKDTVGVVD